MARTSRGPISRDDLAKARSLCALATPGPWRFYVCDAAHVVSTRIEYRGCDRVALQSLRPCKWTGGLIDATGHAVPRLGDERFDDEHLPVYASADQQFVAFARAFLPQLVDAYEALLKAKAEAR